MSYKTFIRIQISLSRSTSYK